MSKTDHHIAKGNEKCGFCNVCGFGGDLTTITCEEAQKLGKIIEEKLKRGDVHE